jgi:hypothetical protein
MTSKPVFRFQHPFRLLITGPSQSGKTYFTKRLISRCQEMISPPPTQIIWAYGEVNTAQSEQIRKISPIPIYFVEGLPDTDELTGGERTLIVLDDLMHAVGKSERMSEIFTQMSHHRNISVILMLQNIFHQGKAMRDISVNAKYIVQFKNPRDNGQIRHLARQVYPTNPQFLIEAFKKATKRPHGYTLMDFSQDTPEDRRVLTNIFSPPEVTMAYVPTKKRRLSSV